jgi:DNA-binding NtrC family response regulator
MNHGAQVLVVGRDQMLLQTRKLILGAFFQVETAGRVPEAEGMMAGRAFDLVVLCYSLADDEFLKVIDLAQRQIPTPKILIMISAMVNRPDRSGCDQELASEEGPYAFLRKISEMLGQPLKAMGRPVQV